MIFACKCKKCGKDVRVKTEYYTGDVWQTSATILNRTIYIICPDCKHENVFTQRFKYLDMTPVEED